MSACDMIPQSSKVWSLEIPIETNLFLNQDSATDVSEFPNIFWVLIKNTIESVLFSGRTQELFRKSDS